MSPRLATATASLCGELTLEQQRKSLREIFKNFQGTPHFAYVYQPQKTLRQSYRDWLRFTHFRGQANFDFDLYLRQEFEAGNALKPSSYGSFVQEVRKFDLVDGQERFKPYVKILDEYGVDLETSTIAKESKSYEVFMKVVAAAVRHLEVTRVGKTFPHPFAPGWTIHATTRSERLPVHFNLGIAIHLYDKTVTHKVVTVNDHKGRGVWQSPSFGEVQDLMDQLTALPFVAVGFDTIKWVSLLTPIAPLTCAYMAGDALITVGSESPSYVEAAFAAVPVAGRSIAGMQTLSATVPFAGGKAIQPFAKLANWERVLALSSFNEDFWVARGMGDAYTEAIWNPLSKSMEVVGVSQERIAQLETMAKIAIAQAPAIGAGGLAGWKLAPRFSLLAPRSGALLGASLPLAETSLMSWADYHGETTYGTLRGSAKPFSTHWLENAKASALYSTTMWLAAPRLPGLVTLGEGEDFASGSEEAVRLTAGGNPGLAFYKTLANLADAASPSGMVLSTFYAEANLAHTDPAVQDILTENELKMLLLPNPESAVLSEPPSPSPLAIAKESTATNAEPNVDSLFAVLVGSEVTDQQRWEAIQKLRTIQVEDRHGHRRTLSASELDRRWERYLAQIKQPPRNLGEIEAALAATLLEARRSAVIAEHNLGARFLRGYDEHCQEIGLSQTSPQYGKRLAQYLELARKLAKTIDITWEIPYRMDAAAFDQMEAERHTAMVRYLEAHAEQLHHATNAQVATPKIGADRLAVYRELGFDFTPGAIRAPTDEQFFHRLVDILDRSMPNWQERGLVPVMLYSGGASLMRAQLPGVPPPQAWQYVTSGTPQELLAAEPSLHRLGDAGFFPIGAAVEIEGILLPWHDENHLISALTYPDYGAAMRQTLQLAAANPNLVRQEDWYSRYFWGLEMLFAARLQPAEMVRRLGLPSSMVTQTDTPLEDIVAHLEDLPRDKVLAKIKAMQLLAPQFVEPLGGEVVDWTLIMGAPKDRQAQPLQGGTIDWMSIYHHLQWVVQNEAALSEQELGEALAMAQSYLLALSRTEPGALLRAVIEPVPSPNNPMQRLLQATLPTPSATSSLAPEQVNHDVEVSVAEAPFEYAQGSVYRVLHHESGQYGGYLLARAATVPPTPQVGFSGRDGLLRLLHPPLNALGAALGVKRISITKDGVITPLITYPDWQEVNGYIATTQAGDLPIEFKMVSVAGHLDNHQAARYWSQGLWPYARRGDEHFHDIGVHWSYLVMPRLYLQETRAKMRFLFALQESRTLAKNAALQAMVKQWINDYLVALDLIGARLGTFLPMLGNRDGKSRKLIGEMMIEGLLPTLTVKTDKLRFVAVEQLVADLAAQPSRFAWSASELAELRRLASQANGLSSATVQELVQPEGVADLIQEIADRAMIELQEAINAPEPARG